jgi:hypothetical protein
MLVKTCGHRHILVIVVDAGMSVCNHNVLCEWEFPYDGLFVFVCLRSQDSSQFFVIELLVAS